MFWGLSRVGNLVDKYSGSYRACWHSGVDSGWSCHQHTRPHLQVTPSISTTINQYRSSIIRTVAWDVRISRAKWAKSRRIIVDYRYQNPSIAVVENSLQARLIIGIRTTHARKNTGWRNIKLCHWPMKIMRGSLKVCDAMESLFQIYCRVRPTW